MMNTSLLARWAGSLLAVLLVCGLGVNVKAQTSISLDDELSRLDDTQQNEVVQLFFGDGARYFINSQGEGIKSGQGSVSAIEIDRVDLLRELQNENHSEDFSQVELVVIKGATQANARSIAGSYFDALPKLRYIYLIPTLSAGDNGNWLNQLAINSSGASWRVVYSRPE